MYFIPHGVLTEKALDIVKKFEEDNQSFRGKKINYFYIDAEEQESMAEDFGVESYPSLYLVVNGNRVYYDANVKESLLKNSLRPLCRSIKYFIKNYFKIHSIYILKWIVYSQTTIVISKMMKMSIRNI